MKNKDRITNLEKEIDRIDKELKETELGILSFYMAHAVEKANFKAKYGLELENDVLEKEIKLAEDSLNQMKEDNKKRKKNYNLHLTHDELLWLHDILESERNTSLIKNSKHKNTDILIMKLVNLIYSI